MQWPELIITIHTKGTTMAQNNQYAFGMEYYVEYTLEIVDPQEAAGRTALDISHVDIEEPEDGFTDVLSAPDDPRYLKYAGTLTIDHLLRLFSVMLPEASNPPEVVSREQHGEMQSVSLSSDICSYDDQGYALKSYARESVLVCPIPVYLGEGDLPDEVVDSEQFTEPYGIVFTWLETYPALELMQQKYCPDEMRGFIVETATSKKEPDTRLVVLKEDYLSKSMLMDLDEGLYIESNLMRDGKNLFSEPVAPTKQERELQWKRIKAAGANHRLCYVCSLEKIYRPPADACDHSITKGDITISLTNTLTNDPLFNQNHGRRSLVWQVDFSAPGKNNKGGTHSTYESALENYNALVRTYIGDENNPPMKFDDIIRIDFVDDIEDEKSPGVLKEEVWKTYYTKGPVPENLQALLENFCINELPEFNDGFDDYESQVWLFMEVQQKKPWGFALVADDDVERVVAEMKIRCTWDLP